MKHEILPNRGYISASGNIMISQLDENGDIKVTFLSTIDEDSNFERATALAEIFECSSIAEAIQKKKVIMVSDDFYFCCRLSETKKEAVISSNAISSFRDEFDFLSNMYETPVEFEGATYRCSESTFQAAKSLKEATRASFEKLNGFDAKSSGKRVDLRPDWSIIRVWIMLEILRSKFSNPELAEKLKATGNRQLVEGNYWNDTYWGVCDGNGLNILGRLLMKVRSELQ